MGEVKDLRKEVKLGLLAFVVVLTTLAAFGTVAYMAPTKSSKPEPPRREFPQFPPKRLKLYESLPWIPWAFLKNATPTTYTGNIMNVSNRILILNVAGESVNIVMASKWILDGKILTLHDLFVKGTLSVGQSVMISALVYSVSHIYIAFGYKITIGTTTIPAVLPFNVR